VAAHAGEVTNISAKKSTPPKVMARSFESFWLSISVSVS
jgi:hypothetical protein